MIRDSTINVESFDENLVLNILPNFVNLTFENVRIIGARTIPLVKNQQKFVAENLVFLDKPDEICHTDKVTNELVCNKDPDLGNQAPSGRPSIWMPALIFLAMHFLITP